VRALGSDGRRVLAGGLDGTIVVHDAATLAPLASLEAHAQVHALACSPDKKRAVSGGLDGELHFWSLERLAPTGPGPFASRRRIALSPDGKLLAWGNLHGEVGVTDLARGVDLWRARVHAGGVMDVELSSDGKLVATAGKDGFARVWGLDGALVLETPKAPGVVQRAVFSPDSRKLVACGAHGLLAVTDLATRETLSCPGAAESGVMAVAFLPDGRTFVTGSSDRSLQLWNLDTRAASGPRVTDAHAEFLCNVVVSPGGTRLMSSAWDHTVKVWDAHSLALVRELPGSERVCWALAFLDERRALVGSYDGLLRLWDVATGEVQDELSIASSTDAFLSFALAPDRRSFHASTERGVVLHFGID
jgi:WD40 repeat protein